IIGNAHSTEWIYIPWVLGFAGLTLVASVVEALVPHVRLPVWQVRRAALFALLAVLGVVSFIALAAVIWIDHLPELIGGGHWTPLDEGISYLGTAMLTAGIAVILLSIGARNELFLWLSVALTAMVFGNLLATAAGSRFTVGWTVSRLSWVISGCALFLYFLAQFVQQQRLLARSRDALEQRVATRTDDLTRMIVQRDLLLREVHHRVKNNFQVVNSLIHLQTRHADADETRDALDHLQRRVYALGLVHKLLMQSSDLSTFDIRDFLNDLCTNLTDTDQHSRVSAEADPIQVDLDFAGSLGLLVTELVMNALKRRFPENQPSSVLVALRRGSADTLVLTVADDGTDEINLFPLDSAGTESRIMKALIAQVQGTLHVTREGGTKVTVVLRDRGTQP
ncbi:MAG TPA: histidine kinase dimerization/phosphoacceptor domain -containing protein, partial [Pseudolabrys sp.]|nr:histidine kinase dimerization/phosphoacceptor domain -containing protein [Pseudolabrys sp.]